MIIRRGVDSLNKAANFQAAQKKHLREGKDERKSDTACQESCVTPRMSHNLLDIVPLGMRGEVSGFYDSVILFVIVDGHRYVIVCIDNLDKSVKCMDLSDCPYLLKLLAGLLT